MLWISQWQLETLLLTLAYMNYWSKEGLKRPKVSLGINVLKKL